LAILLAQSSGRAGTSRSAGPFLLSFSMLHKN
jgi:hypothetical protein